MRLPAAFLRASDSTETSALPGNTGTSPICTPISCLLCLRTASPDGIINLNLLLLTPPNTLSRTEGLIINLNALLLTPPNIKLYRGVNNQPECVTINPPQNIELYRGVNNQHECVTINPPQTLSCTEEFGANPCCIRPLRMSRAQIKCTSCIVLKYTQCITLCTVVTHDGSVIKFSLWDDIKKWWKWCGIL